MAPGTKRQASQAPRVTSKKTKTVNTKKARDEDAASSSDRDGTGPGDADDIVINDNDLLIPRAAKTDEWVTRFRAIIEKKEKEILKHLEMRKAAIKNETATLQSQMLPVFAQALLPIDANEEPRDVETREPLEINSSESSINVGFPVIEHQELYEKTKALMIRSKNLVDIYQTLSNTAAPAPDAVRLQNVQKVFEKDKESTRRSFAAGKNVALTDVQGMLADRYHEVRGRSGLHRDEEARGRTLLAKGKGADQEGETGGEVNSEGAGQDVLMGWGNVAVDMQKAVKRLDDVVGHD